MNAVASLIAGGWLGIEEVMSSKNYYDILGIAKDASTDEIKKAFRRQAVKHHPDRGGDEAKFKELNEAYEVLSNPEKKQRYDQFGEAGLGGRGGSSRAGGFSSAEDFSFNFGGGLGDIFGSIFGQNQTQTPKTGRDVEIVLNLTFKEAIFGIEKEIRLTLNDVCRQCRGSCAKPGTKVQTCGDCSGRGQRIKIVKTMLGNLQQQTTCPACSGRGQRIETPCPKCRGQGVEGQEKTIEVVVPAGISDGQTIRLRDYGERNKSGLAGDLYIIVQVEPDKHFTREGDLILSQEEIDFVQASLGAQIKVRTVDGEVTMRIPAGTQGGSDFRLTKRGVPHMKGGGRGDHIVRIIVKTPTKLSSQQKQLLKDFSKL